MSSEPQDDRLGGRNGAIWRAYVAGETQASIAERFGLTQGGVSTIIRKVKDALPPEDLDERRVRLTELLDESLARMVTVMRAEPVPLYSNGKPVMDPETGLVARDWTGQANAIRTMLPTMERMAKMLGLDAPTQTNVTVVAQARDAAVTAASEAAARLAAAGRPALPPGDYDAAPPDPDGAPGE